MAAGVNVSIERVFFPALLDRGDKVLGPVHRGYWIDIGTPEKYLQVHRDILNRRFPVPLDGAARGRAASSTRAPRLARGAARRPLLRRPAAASWRPARASAGRGARRRRARRPGRLRARQRPAGVAWQSGADCEVEGSLRRARACGSAARACCATPSSARAPSSATTRARSEARQAARRPRRAVERSTRHLQGLRRPRPRPLAAAPRGRAPHRPRVRRLPRREAHRASAATAASRRPRSPRPSSRAPARRARRSPTSGSSPPTCSTTTSPATTSTAARSSPPRTTRRSGTGSSWSGSGALALSGDAGIKEIREWLVAGRYADARRAETARCARRPTLGRRLRAPLPLVRRHARGPAAEGRARHGERHGCGRAHRRSSRTCRDRRPCACTSTSTARSRTTPPIP